ncbi:MAG: pyridoxal phosphate-dependent aminotransferase family protein [Desulfobacterales bacterium]|nr:pyridoxal phosphate-dependent aminotransferase family protein [Desulfobacterales bacterium]
MFKERFENRLALQLQTGLFRNPFRIDRKEGKYLFIEGKKVLNFGANDYLGMSVSEELKQKVAGNFQRYNTSSSSSRLVSGNYSVINQAEKEYARYFGYENALFFPSGYQANLGILSTFFEKGDAVFFDKHVHASSIKGMTLSGAGFYGYNHNSMSHLHKRIEGKSQKQVAVVTESLFSMDGDLLDVNNFERLKRRFGFLAIVDEAHAFGAIGKGGRGIAHDVADIAVGTLGKALGLFGAFVLLPEGFKEYLFNFCSPLIYTTSLPEAHAASAIDLLKMISESGDARTRLKHLSDMMKGLLKEEGFKIRGDAHIIAIEFGDEARTVSISRSLLKRDIFVLPMRYPTVPVHKSILRIGMTAIYTENDVKYFVEALRDAVREVE